jgi:hypothetical protein
MRRKQHGDERIPDLLDDQLGAFAAGLAGETAEKLVVLGVCRHGDNPQPQRLRDCQPEVADAGAGLCARSGARPSSLSMYHVVNAMYTPHTTTGM